MTRIAIIGAGIAGLNAALTLQDAGLSCQIYEASGRIGGRMHSDAQTWGDGMVSEACGEFIDPEHTTLHQLIQRFGLRTRDLGSGRTDRTRSLMYFCHRVYSAEELIEDFQTLGPLLQEQYQATGFPTTFAHLTPEGKRLDHLSVTEWIEQYVPGGCEVPAGRLLETACTGFYGLDANVQSALNLVCLFGRPDPAQGSLLSGPAQNSCTIAGGNEQLPLALMSSLPSASFHLNHQLVALARSGPSELRLTFATSTGSLEVACDHAILTLPFSTLRHVDLHQAGFDERKRQAIAALGYGTISKLFLQFDRPFWFEDGPWPRLDNGFVITDLPVQVFWDASPYRSGSKGLLVNYAGGHYGAAYGPAAASVSTAHTPDVRQVAQHCLQQLEEIFPGISTHFSGKAALSYPTGDPFLRGSYACWRVGQYTRFAGYEGVRQGSVHFAGEHCSVEFQGFMEGAAREGARAAQEVVQELAGRENQQAAGNRPGDQ